jgi:hypothetical protein
MRYICTGGRGKGVRTTGKAGDPFEVTGWSRVARRGQGAEFGRRARW